MGNKKFNDPSVELLTALPPDYQFILIDETDGKIYRITADTVRAAFGGTVGATLEPIARAGLDQSITMPTSQVTLDGSGSTAPVGRTIVAYQWSKVSGPSSFNITSPNSPITTVTGLVAGNYIFQLTVTDNTGATNSDTLVVVANSQVGQTGPVVNAGPGLTWTVPEGQTRTIHLVGSVVEGDAPIVQLLWTRLSGPGTPVIAGANSLETDVLNVPAGTHVFRLRAIDGNSLAASSQTTQTITVQTQPVVITQQPVSVSAVEGDFVSFFVGYTGVGPVTIQWYKNGSPVPGGNSAQLNIATVDFSHEGTYQANLTNPGGTVQTNSVTLSVSVVGGTITIARGWSSFDPYTNDSTTPPLDNIGTFEIAPGANIETNFPQSAQDKYLWWRIPATQPTPTSYDYSTGLGGVIPDAAIRQPFEIAGFKYVVTRVPFTFEYTAPVTLKH